MPADMHVPEPATRPLHVKLVKGRWYWDPPDRLRKSHGLKTIALGADQAAAWGYAAILNRENLQLGPGAPVVGTIRWLFDSFLAGERAQALAPATRRDYRWLALRVIGPLRLGPLTVGEMPAMAIRPRHADRIYALIVEANGAAAGHYATRFARRVWKWAARKELVDQNPWREMELKGLPKRTGLWTAAQVADVVAAAEAAGRPSIGLATLLGYWLGHRQADVLNLTWTALEAGMVETRKTGRVLPIDVSAYPELEAALAGERRSSTHVVVREAVQRKGAPPAIPQPYQRHTFGHEWRMIAAKAGIPPELQFRDLRSTALTELADAGADIIPMSTHGGHETLQINRRYARPTVAQFRAAAGRRMEHRANGQGKSNADRKPALEDGR